MARHRGRNEGSISERGGKFRAQIFDPAGKRISETFRTKKEASSWLLEKKKDFSAGIVSDINIKTLGDYAELWLEFVRENRRPRTFEQYSDIWRKHLAPTFGQRPLDDIRAIELERFFSQKKKDGTGERTLELVYTVLNMLFKRAVNQHLIGYNPCSGVEKPDYAPKEAEAVSIEEGNRLLWDTDLTLYEKAFIFLALTTGLRRGELLGLRWQDVDLDILRISVVQQVQYIRGQGTVISQKLKTKQSKREIYFPDECKQALLEHRREQLKLRTFQGARWQDYDLVFSSSIGTPKNPSNLNKRLREMLDAAEIENARLHDFRHGMLTTANNVLRADGKVLEKIGGHSHTTQMGMKVYVHAPKEAEPYQEIAKGFGRLYGARNAGRQDDFGYDYEI